MLSTVHVASLNVCRELFAYRHMLGSYSGALVSVKGPANSLANVHCLLRDDLTRRALTEINRCVNDWLHQSARIVVLAAAVLSRGVVPVESRPRECRAGAAIPDEQL